MDTMNDLMKQRREKLDKIVEQGHNPYAFSFPRTDFATETLAQFEADGDETREVALAGRLMAIRRMGKAAFVHLMDRTGRIQLYVKRDAVGEDAYAMFKLTDLGDIVGVKGTLFRTRTGEPTVHVNHVELLSKTLRPLPVVKEKTEGDEKVVYDAFADKETRYRQRYVDLIVNPDVRETFIKRSKIVSGMRHFLEDRGYLEVETPVLQPVYGGATARPFVTHHNTLDMPLYLRIADELYLKRLIVGGFDGVFEIAKDFRNEGMDKDHNPEFTMMELYVAFQDYTFMMDLVEEMTSKLCQDVMGSMVVPFGDEMLDFTPPWPRKGFLDSIEEATGHNLLGKSEDEIRTVAKSLKLDVDEVKGAGQLLDAIFSEFVEPKLVQPTFIVDLPLELSPLAKKHRSKPGLTERFEAFVARMELCNSFSELNDPIDQRERFEAQAALKAQGDEEAMMVDEDYLRAMEFGLPPTAGLGMGIDRLAMILTNSPSIRDVVLFPQMRPEK